VNPKRLWGRIQQRHVHNIDFDDFVRLVEAFGFDLDRQQGTSHQIFRHANVVERLNLQPGRDGSAKPYQVREFARYVADYGLTLGGEEAE
jgi:predicted RNA binding protein YcfA (HicA-like mRNA interferase family)